MSLSKSTSAGRWKRLAGNRRLLLLCLLLFLVSAVLSFWTFFPAEVLQRRLVQEASRQAGLQISSRKASLLFPLGIELDLKIYPVVDELKPIDLQKLQVTPVWTSLFGKAQAVAVKGGLADGSFSGQADRNGQLELEFSNIAIGQLQNDSLPYRATGQLQGWITGEQLTSPNAAKGAFNLTLSAANILGLDKLGLDKNFALGRLEVDGKFTQRRLSLEKVVMIEGLVEMSGGGTLLIGNTPQRTRLNLNVRIHPTQSTPAALKDLINMTGVKPAADGSYMMRIGGTLANPTLR